MTLQKIGIVALSAFALSGCASKLRVWNASSEVAGVPFNAPVVYRKDFKRNRHSELGEKCSPTPVVQMITLPMGERFYANVDPAQFAKTGFSMNFSENGALSQITLNTEPSGAENIKATTEAITGLAPLLGLGVRSGSQSVTSSANDLPGCDMGESEVVFTKFEGGG